MDNDCMDQLRSLFTHGYYRHKSTADQGGIGSTGGGGRDELTGGSLSFAEQDDQVQVQDKEDLQEEEHQEEVVDQSQHVVAGSLEFEEELLLHGSWNVDPVGTNNTDPVVVVGQDIMPVAPVASSEHNSLGNPPADESIERNLTTNDQHHQHEPSPSLPQMTDCDVCGECYLSKETLIAHMKTHEKRQIVQAVIRNMELLRIAQIVQVQSPPPPAKASSSNRNRNRSGCSSNAKREKYNKAISFDLKCEFCSETFFLKSMLEEHNKQFHMPAAAPRPPPAIASCSNTNRIGCSSSAKRKKYNKAVPFDFICEFCSKRFLLKTMLKEHEEQNHSHKPAAPAAGKKLAKYKETKAAADDTQKRDLALELAEIVHRLTNNSPSPKKGDDKSVSISTAAGGSLFPTSANDSSLPMTMPMAIDSNKQEDVTETTREKDSPAATANMVTATSAASSTMPLAMPMETATVRTVPKICKWTKINRKK